MNAAIRIAQTLDLHLSHPTQVVVFGTGALLLDPAFQERLRGRMTNDIDLIIPLDRELEIEADQDFWGAIEATNRDLEPTGLYLTHIFPEKEVVLMPSWKDHVQALDHPEFRHLRLVRPQMLDLIISKMGRGDAKDLDDVRTMLELEPIAYKDLVNAVENVQVPKVYMDIFPAARDRILDVAETFEKSHGLPNDFLPEPPKPPDIDI